MFDGVPDTLRLNLTSTIVYSSSASTNPDEPLQIDAYANSVDDFHFKPLAPAPVSAPDFTFAMNMFFDTYDNGVNRASFNNITFNAPTVPAIFSALTLDEAAAENPKAYGPSTSVATYGQIVELEVYNWDAGECSDRDLYGREIMQGY